MVSTLISNLTRLPRTSGGRPSLPGTAAGQVTIPMVNLAGVLAATESAWRGFLAEVQADMQFILGRQGGAFEAEFARSLGAKHAVGVGTGTAAIELCLRAAAITDRDQEVLTSALTSPFTAQAILAAGATPLFADVDPETLQIDAADVAERITARTAALLPVHLYGQAGDLPRLAELAKSRQIALVQDACQAHGATYRQRPFSSFSPYVAYSFYPTKNLGCLGDGGAIVTDRTRTAHRLSALRDGGRRGDQVSRWPAINSRLDELQACFLRAFLPSLHKWNTHRARLARLYDQALAGCPAVRLVRRWPCSAHHLYVVRVQRRNALREFLLAQGIQTAVHYPVPLHLHPAFRSKTTPKGSFPHAERACREILSLPLGPHVTESNVLYVAEQIRRFYTRPASERVFPIAVVTRS